MSVAKATAYESLVEVINTDVKMDFKSNHYKLCYTNPVERNRLKRKTTGKNIPMIESVVRGSTLLKAEAFHTYSWDRPIAACFDFHSCI